VFIDPRVEDAQALLKNVDPNAKVVVLDPSVNGIKQIVDALANETDVSVIHIVAMGTGERLLLGSGALDADAMQGLGAQRLASISEHLTSDASIQIHGAVDFGAGEAPVSGHDLQVVDGARDDEAGWIEDPVALERAVNRAARRLLAAQPDAAGHVALRIEVDEEHSLVGKRE